MNSASRHLRTSFLLFVLLLLLVPIPSSLAFLLQVPDPIVHLATGAIAGICGAISYQPFDYVKARIQSDRNGERYGNDGISCLVDTLNADPSRLFTGLAASVVGVAPEKSLKLGVYDILGDAFVAHGGAFPMWGRVLSGAVAGACQVLVSSPVDVVKIRMQTRDNAGLDDDDAKADEPVTSLDRLLEVTGGFDGLYRGVGACLLRDVSFTAVCLPMYAILLDHGADAFVAGALSGMVSTGIATPFDMVKTRILTADCGMGRDAEEEISELSNDDSRTSRGRVEDAEVPPVRKWADGGGAAVAVPAMMSMGGNGTAALLLESRTIVPAEPAESRPPRTTNLGHATDFKSPSFGSPVESEQLATFDALPSFDRGEGKLEHGSDNPFEVARNIVEREGVSVLFTGVHERCIGAVPRFGITLGAHDWLEHVASNAGLLSHA